MTAIKLCLLTICGAFVLSEAAVSTAPAAAQACAGDCNGDQSVTINEVVLGVGIALADAPIGDCGAMDGDGNGAVTVDELVAAVVRALHGCGESVPPTHTRAPAPTGMSPTSTPTRTSTPEPTKSDEAVLTASERVATDPIFRLFDFQASVDTTVRAAGAMRAGIGAPAGVAACQQFDCFAFGNFTGTERDCCLGTRFTQVFSDCTFDDDLGRIVRLDGAFNLDGDTAALCAGTIPFGVSFRASLSGFTQDVSFPDGSFSRTFQELSESFEVAPGIGAVSQPDPSGFGIRGDGRRFINGELQQFQSDGFGNVLVDSESDIHALEIAVASTQEPDGATVAAALNGSVTGADFRVGAQFRTDFMDFHVVQHPQAGALLLGLNGTVGTDCLGDVILSTIEPLRVVPGDTCFTGGRLEIQLGDGTESVTYTESAGLDLDFGADGGVDQHFATCTDVAVNDQCGTSAIGLCGACSALSQCQRGLGCFACSANCSGNTMRCSLPDTFATCEDGVF